jgi:hypothetical protein
LDCRREQPNYTDHDSTDSLARTVYTTIVFVAARDLKSCAGMIAAIICSTRHSRV